VPGFNHQPWCTCGWCSGGYRGGPITGGRPASPVNREVKVERNSLTISAPWAWEATPEFRSLDSYTIPNASCPECGVQVFFFKSPYNGRVFFDSLGPPWPKHPCMDNAAERHATHGEVPLGSGVRSGRESSWLREGWRPYLVNEHQALSNVQDGWQLRGVRNGEALVLYIISPGWHKAALVHAKRNISGGFRISAAVPAEDGDLHEVATDAYESVLELLSHEASKTLRVVPPLASTLTSPGPPSPVGAQFSNLRSGMAQHATNVQASLGWRTFELETIDRLPGGSDGWRIRGTWFNTIKVLHFRAEKWGTATQILARREDPDRFSLSVRIRTENGEDDVVTVDAFERRESIEEMEPSHLLRLVKQIEQRLKADQNAGSSVTLIVGATSSLILLALAERLSIEPIPSDAPLDASPTELTSHLDLLAWAAKFRLNGPVLLDGSKVLPELAKHVNPMWALAMLSVGRQLVAAWPGRYIDETITLTVGGVDFAYPVGTLSVWTAD
jgi:hypothetical protein